MVPKHAVRYDFSKVEAGYGSVMLINLCQDYSQYNGSHYVRCPEAG